MIGKVQMVHYCPQCASITAAHFRTCCPDSQPFSVPAEIAMQAREGFFFAIAMDDAKRAAQSLQRAMAERLIA